MRVRIQESPSERCRILTHVFGCLMLVLNKSKLILGIGLATILLAGATDSDAQTEYEDVVYLKNGEIRRGIIIEEIPYERIKIKTKDGNVFVYIYDDIEKMTKERSLTPRLGLRAVPITQKSPLGAVVLAWLVPSAGHAYAGDWGRGAKFIALDIGSFIVMGVGLSKTEVSCGWAYCEETLTDEGAGYVGLGFLSLLGFRIWEFVDAYHTAKDYNRGKLSNLSVDYGYIGEVPSLKMSYRF